jgi:hypothetical protein
VGWWHGDTSLNRKTAGILEVAYTRPETVLPIQMCELRPGVCQIPGTCCPQLESDLEDFGSNFYPLLAEGLQGSLFVHYPYPVSQAPGLLAVLFLASRLVKADSHHPWDKVSKDLWLLPGLPRRWTVW